MNYLDQVRNNVLSKDGGPIAVEVKDRILFQSYLTRSKEEAIPLKDIIRNIGIEEDIHTIIDHYKKWTEPNPQLFVYIACNLSQRLINSEKSKLKVLDFVIRNVTTGNIVLSGGIQFQNGKLSFYI
ncbi:MAG: hypothetical protein ACTSPB_07340 [Candidatus Thorarchaeota archaeon]